MAGVGLRVGDGAMARLLAGNGRVRGGCSTPPGQLQIRRPQGPNGRWAGVPSKFVEVQKCPLNKLHQAIRRSGKTGAPVKPGRHPQPKLSATALVHVGTEYGRRTGPWPGDNRAEQTSSTSKSKHTMHCGSSAAVNRENRKIGRIGCLQGQGSVGGQGCP